MTLHVDWTAVDQPARRLTLESEGRNYIVCHNDTVYMRSPSLQTCLRFLKAGADRGDWLIDDASVERATWHSTIGEGEPESGAAACAEDTSPNRLGLATAGSSPSPVPPETFSRAVLADVIPIKRGA